MRRIRPLLWSLSLTVLLVACGGEESTDTTASSSASAESEPLPGKVRDVEAKPVPDLTLETMEGGSIDLADQEGRVLLVNFWATWCAPCREEIPDLNALQAELGGDGLRVIGIALDRQGREKVEPFAEKLSIEYPIVIDAEGTAESEFGPIPGLPTTIVVGPDGQITKRVVGIFPVDEMTPTLKEMLNAGEPPSDAT
ncbi:MAG: TlpA family protein disulfide reductase [Bacteroidetes bacterium QH_2_64_26]|nr:MAG: TlpA family protein disulfide reductase [Bacteroidetes bacterium QH_2_64_26]